jgi:hydrogenase maturation protease
MNEEKHDLIIGVGNTLLSDDGVGIHIIRKMEEENVLDQVEYLDMGTSSMELGYYINENIRKMVIIDSIKTGEKPGTIFMLRPEDLISKKSHDYSLHQLKLIDTLKLISLDRDFPDTIIVGIAPYDIETFSEQLSPGLRADFKDVYVKVVRVIKKYLGKE